ncbi:MAG: hypothetical protein GX577_08030 [Leptolinea sp.]|nr:hypothetical protein [Leptolinea sp.]
MTSKKIDGIIETARYDPEGKISLVRVYEKRGSTFSDLVLLTREQFISKLRTGKKFYVGKRIPYQASTFELGDPVSTADRSGFEVVISGPGRGIHDYLPDVPLF